jgi:rhomboid protease GluP
MNQNQPLPPETTSPPTGYAGQAIARPVFRPYVTYALIATCVVVFLLQAATNNPAGVILTNSTVTRALDKDNSMILHGQLWRLITPMFLHGSISHLAINMFSLFYIGPSVERFYRRWRYLALFLIGGFAGNVMSFIFTASPSLGASTAIFGLLGAEGVLLFQNREIFERTAQALSQLVIVAIINLVYSVATPGIDFWGHVGGLIGGMLFAWFGGPLLRRQGNSPPFYLTDARSDREVIVAGIAVTGLFFFLTVVVLFLRVA